MQTNLGLKNPLSQLTPLCAEKLWEDKVVLRRRTRSQPSLLPSQLSFLLWFVVITKIYACCSTNLLPAIMSLSAQSRDGPMLSDARGKSARGAPWHWVSQEPTPGPHGRGVLTDSPIGKKTCYHLCDVLPLVTLVALLSCLCSQSLQGGAKRPFSVSTLVQSGHSRASPQAELPFPAWRGGAADRIQHTG